MCYGIEIRALFTDGTEKTRRTHRGSSFREPSLPGCMAIEDSFENNEQNEFLATKKLRNRSNGGAIDDFWVDANSRNILRSERAFIYDLE